MYLKCIQYSFYDANRGLCTYIKINEYEFNIHVKSNMTKCFNKVGLLEIELFCMKFSAFYFEV